MERMWWDRPFTRTGVEIGATGATLHVLTSYGVAQVIEMRTNAKGFVDRFDVTLAPPTINTWSDIDRELTKSGARYSYQASKVTDGKCTTVAGTNVDMPLPLASIFKLYVLLAVSHAVNAGTLDWNDQLTITAEAKAVGSAGLDELEPGAQRLRANRRSEDDLVQRQHGHRSADRQARTGRRREGPRAGGPPRPGQHDAVPDRARAVLHRLGQARRPRTVEDMRRPRQRAVMLAQTKTRPYEPDPWRTHTPASPYGVEWYGSAGDICRVHAALQASAVGRAAPVKDILSAVPGIDLDTSNWGYIGAKGGNLPGDIGVQLVRRRPHGTGLGGQLPVELAAVPKPDGGHMVAVDREACLRDAPHCGANAAASLARSTRAIHSPERKRHDEIGAQRRLVHARRDALSASAIPSSAGSRRRRDGAAPYGSPAQCRCARTTSAAHRAR